MNTLRILTLLLSVCIVRVQAQDNPAPAPAPEPAQTEMQKWIATTDAQWQAAFKRDVTDVHEADLNKVKLQYLTSLETGIAKASSAGDLDGAVALRNEQKRFGDTNVFPEQDEAADAASVKQLRAGIRVQLAKLETADAARTKALHAKYDAVLTQAQTQLTQRQRLDDALLVKTKRDEVAAAWITPAVAAATEKASPPQPAAKPALIAKPNVRQPATEAPSATAEDMTKRLIGTKWIWNNEQMVTFLDDGKAQCSGLPPTWTWKVTSASRRQIAGVHTQRGSKFTFTFDRNFKTATIDDANDAAHPRKTRDVTNE